MTELSQFISQMKNEADGFEKRVQQLTLRVATDVRRRTIRKIDATFNKTQRSSKSGKTVSAGSKGGLRDDGSVMLKLVGRYPGVEVGGNSVGVPYAAIHEYGGIVRPVKAKALTIPLAPRYVGTRAREWDLFLLPREGKPALLMNKETNEPAFVLLKSVTIPARPYFRPAIEESLASDAMVLAVKAVWGDSPLPWEVRSE